MTRNPLSRSRSSTHYQPSDAERRKAVQIIAKLTPSSDDYQHYGILIDTYRRLVGPLVRNQQGGVIRGLGLRRSKLFDDREYLVAHVDDDWLNRFAPGCDAACSPMVEPSGDREQWLQTPPLVFIPYSKRRARSNAFRSVVEHEIVHVNQAIMGTFPELPTGRRAEDLLDFLLSLATAEYHACFVQLVRWTNMFPTDAEVSLDHWCLLCGYSQALERVLSVVVCSNFSALSVQDFLNALEATLPDMLRRAGAVEELIPWFTPRLHSHLVIAVKTVESHLPAAQEHPAFRAAVRWLRARRNSVAVPLRTEIGTTR